MYLNQRYKETLEYMFSKLPMFQRVGTVAYKKDLTNIKSLCEFLGNPQNNFKSIHIAGTNGKGSVSHLLSASFQVRGYKAGLYVSPHYKDYRERIKVNGNYISKTFVVDFIERLKPTIDAIQPSFFEINVAMAFEYFSRQKVDIAIIETGLGGRLDSTNIIEPLMCVITNISFDHMNLLGNTLPEIAAEKAGIIKKGIPVVIGEKQEEVVDVFMKKAKEQSSKINFASENYNAIIKNSDLNNTYFDLFKNAEMLADNVPFNFHGTFQQNNVVTVLQAIEDYNKVLISKSGRRIELTDLLTAGKNLKKLTKFRGRWQVLNEKPLIICDSGHNESGIRYVIEQLNQAQYDNLHIVIGVVNDKDIRKMICQFPVVAKYYFCKANIPRGLDAGILKSIASEFGLRGRKYISVKNALAAAKRAATESDLVFIGGSTFVVAEVI